jgi:hypothetical protein
VFDKEDEKPTIAIPKQPEIYDPYDENKGSCLTFSYKEGLVAKVLPNGDVT